MRSWNLGEIETPAGSRSPVVLDSEESAARAVVIGLEPGQRLGEHEVKEHAFVLVLDGSVEVESGGETAQAAIPVGDCVSHMSTATPSTMSEGIRKTSASRGRRLRA